MTFVLVVERKRKKGRERVPRDDRFLRSDDLIAVPFAKIRRVVVTDGRNRSPILVYPCTEHNRGTTQEGGQPLMRGAYWLDGGARPDANSNATGDVTLCVAAPSVHGCSTLGPTASLSLLSFFTSFRFFAPRSPFPRSIFPSFLPSFLLSFFLSFFPSSALFSSLFSPPLSFFPSYTHIRARSPHVI